LSQRNGLLEAKSILAQNETEILCGEIIEHAISLCDGFSLNLGDIELT
jgi:hypothetical protein